MKNYNQSGVLFIHEDHRRFNFPLTGSRMACHARYDSEMDSTKRKKQIRQRLSR